MKKIILDTNAYTKYLWGDKDVLDVMVKAEVTFMSVFVLGELHAGFRGGEKEKENKSLLLHFLEKPTVVVLDATEETSEVFGEIKDSLKRTGNPIPINDVWIAAHVIESGSVFISYDNHFKNIPGLRIWDKI